MRVKVKTATLIEKIESYKARCEAEIASQAAAHDDAMAEWRDAAIIAAEEVIGMLKDEIDSPEDEDDKESLAFHIQDRFSNDNLSQLVINVPCARPVLPDELDYQIERDLEALKATPDETLSICPEDHLYRYLASPEADVRGRRRR